MKTEVAEKNHLFQEIFEGRERFLYLDVYGWVTIGVGCKLDPVEMALSVPFVDAMTGEKASEALIRSDWQAVKDARHLLGRPAAAFERLTTVRLTDPAIDELARRRTAEFWREIKRNPGLDQADTWPADAQLAVLSLAWAVGPSAFKTTATQKGWPRFVAHMASNRFALAAGESGLRTKNSEGVPNPGVIPRNRAVSALLRAASVTRNPDEISWTSVLREFSHT